MQQVPAKEAPLALVEMQSELTIHQAITQPNQISLLRKEDKKGLQNLMIFLLDNLAESFNVKSSFSAIQLFECATLIIEEFWMLRPEEVLYCFKRAKTGAYGPVYNKLDTPTIMIWLRTYLDEERLQAVEKMNAEFKKQENEPQIDVLAAYEKEMRHVEEHGISRIQKISKEQEEKRRHQVIKNAEYENYRASYYENKNKARNEKSGHNAPEKKQVQEH